MYDGTITLTDPGLVEEVEAPEGFRAFIVYDPLGGHESPREWDGNIVTIINANTRHIDMDEDVAGLREARDHFWGDPHLMERYLSIFRPDVLAYFEHLEWGRDGYGWGYITREAVAEAGWDPEALEDGFLNKVVLCEVEIYRQWAEGEVYGAIATNLATGVEESLWGIYDTYDFEYIKGAVIPDLLAQVAQP